MNFLPVEKWLPVRKNRDGDLGSEFRSWGRIRDRKDGHVIQGLCRAVMVDTCVTQAHDPKVHLMRRCHEEAGLMA